MNYSATILKTNLIAIGDLKAICLPRQIIEQCYFDREVELRLQEHHLEIYAVKPPRFDWDTQFARMARHGDDQLIDPPTATHWDHTEWEW